MKLPKGEESTLLIALADGLREAKLTTYGYLSLPKDWENNTRKILDNDFEKKLYENLDDGGLLSLIQRVCLPKIYESGHDTDEMKEDAPLISFTNFSDTMSIAKEIINEIKLSPHEYVVLMKVSSSLSQSLRNIELDIKIDDRLSIISGNKIKSNICTTTGNEKIDYLFTSYSIKDRDLNSISEDSHYFKYRTSGIISDKTNPKFLRSFHDDVRAFYGACLALKSMFDFPLKLYSEVFPIIVNLIKNGKDNKFHHCELSESDIIDASDRIYLSGKNSKIEREEDFRSIIQPVIDLFGCEDSQKLKTASIWLFRSYINSRGMDKILDATIAIEVLLGDRESSDRIGLSKLMANRCAYSLGKSSKERKELHDFFLNFYKLRSDIVHAGRLNISKAENAVVKRGMDLAARLIQHEAKMCSPLVVGTTPS